MLALRTTPIQLHVSLVAPVTDKSIVKSVVFATTSQSTPAVVPVFLYVSDAFVLESIAVVSDVNRDGAVNSFDHLPFGYFFL